MEFQRWMERVRREVIDKVLRPARLRGRKRRGGPAAETPGLAEVLEPRMLLSGGLSFNNPVTFAVGEKPFSIAVADVNGDGRPDVIVANQYDGTVGVLLGNGDGTFQAQRTFAAGSGNGMPGDGPVFVAVGDLNNDMKPDLAVVNLGDNAVDVLLGNGDGTFKSPVTYATGSFPTSVAIADVNGDTIPDLVVANGGDNTAGLLIGNGDGTFKPEQTFAFATGGGQAQVAVADLNSDGKPDLVAAPDSSSGGTILLGNAGGTFLPPITFPTGSGPQFVAIGDLNHDHIPDLAITNFNDQTVSVLLGNGNGTFGPQTTFATGSIFPRNVVIADVDGDGNPDLVVTNYGDNSVSVLLGNGDGTFQAQQAFSTMDEPTAVAVAPLTSDGKLDLIAAARAAGPNPGVISVLLNATATASAPVVSVVPSANPASAGDTVTFTATVSSTAGPTPTGSVTFLENGTPVDTASLNSSGMAVFSTSFASAGTDEIEADYLGDSTYSPNFISISEAVVQSAKIGGLDPNFATGGLVAHVVGFANTSDVLLQPNGQSVIIGTGGTSPTESLGVTRFNADGSLDTSFGTGGAVLTSVGGDDQAAAGALLPNGNILVAGTATTFVSGQSTGSQFALAEYTSAGALDPSFGGGAGFVLTSFSANAPTLSNDVAHAVVVSPGGEIFVGGSSDAAGHGQDFAIAAFNADGTPATSFGGTGKVLLDFAGGDDSIAALALQPKGSILAAGSSSAGGVGSVALARFLASGALDTHFGVKGKVVKSVRGVDDGASSVAVTPKTGAIVVGGFSATGSAAAGTLSSDFLVLRFTSAGKVDRSFHNSGFAIASFGQPAAVSTVLLLADGTIVASGKTTGSLSSIDPSQLGLAVAKFTARGLPDTSFNGTGQATFNLSTAIPTSLTSAQSPQEQPARLGLFDATADLMMAFNQLIQTAQGAAATTTGGDLVDVGNSGANTVEAAIVTMGLDLADALVGSLPHAVLGGAKGTISVQVRETGTQLASGTFTVELFAAVGGSVASGQSPFASFPARLRLKQGQAVLVHLRFVFPKSLPDGNYNLVATVETGSTRDLNIANNTVASAAAVNISAPFIDLTGSGLLAPNFTGTKPASLGFDVINNGNIPTPPKKSSLQFLASTDGTLANAISLATQPFRPNLRAGGSRVFKTKLALPGSLPAGTYNLLVLIDPADVFSDSNTSNNLIVSGNTFTVG